jgi:catechol 2,3-dioxygenase-like lactoylglutathione lyase family enzyme
VNELYFHVCYVVPDLEAAMEELSRVIGVRWQEPRDRASGDLRWRLVYSEGPLPFIELVEGAPGSPWHTTDGPTIHHIGRFTDDLDEGIRAFESAGGEIELDGREISGRWAYFRVPQSGALIELIEADDRERWERFGVGTPPVSPG